MNHSPPLNQLSHSHIVAHFPPFEMLFLLGNIVEQHDWDSLEKLETLAAQEPGPPPSTAAAGAAPTGTGSGAGGGTEVGAGGDGGAGAGDGDGAGPRAAGGGAGTGAGGGAGGMPMAELMTILTPLLASPGPHDLNVPQIIQLVHALQALGMSGENNPAGT
jgi:hypothetical protein